MEIISIGVIVISLILVIVWLNRKANKKANFHVGDYVRGVQSEDKMINGIVIKITKLSDNTEGKTILLVKTLWGKGDLEIDKDRIEKRTLQSFDRIDLENAVRIISSNPKIKPTFSVRKIRKRLLDKK